MGKSNTAMILNPFLEGMGEAGAVVDLFYTGELNINPCIGEFTCLFRTPGKCYQEDDMQLLYPKMEIADVLVFASPLYAEGVNGPMKNLLDRMLPRTEPFIELRDNRCQHTVHKDTKNSKVVLVSNCSLWELENFDPLVVHMQAFCRNLSFDYAGALLRPHGMMIKKMIKADVSVDDVFEAAKDAGRQLISKGRMEQETLDVVSRELLPREKYMQISNGFSRQTLQALQKK